MLSTPRATRGMISTPHHLASTAGLAVLRDGGNAIEAMVAAAATIAVVYPHMNSLGGDAFWLISPPRGEPIAIAACGGAGQNATPAFYAQQGQETVPYRGPLAANTVAGLVGGWQAALTLSEEMGGRQPVARLLAEAIHYAAQGFPVSQSQAQITAAKRDELQSVPGFAETYLKDGAVRETGEIFRQPRLAESLSALAERGLDDFYRGDLARSLAGDLDRLGSPVTLDDLNRFAAQRVAPLSVDLRHARLFNHPPPTQGVASLMILGIFDRLGVTSPEGADFVHALVEAGKLAHRYRNDQVSDPAHHDGRPAEALTPEALARAAGRISFDKAVPWDDPAVPGDTVWLGAADASGLVVSYIQSIFWEYGSGVVLEDSGILWQNRGASLTVAPGSFHEIRPGRKPFHTLNPALARFGDGRVMAYGAMGGEGQPQFQSAIFGRYGFFDVPLQEAVTAPRWLLGRTWGSDSHSLKLEDRFDPDVIDRLRQLGHRIELVAPFDELAAGHGGAVVHWPNGLLEGAADPRSDGLAACF